MICPDRIARSLLAASAACMVAACAPLYTTPPALVHQPMSARPVHTPAIQKTEGAIYRAGGRSLFDDRRARQVGDTVTINLAEKTSAQKSNNTSTERDSSMSGGLKGLSRLPLTELVGLSADVGSKSSFSGTGNAAANNQVDGSITVTVIEVLGNGNLLVSGEKQVAINQGNEYIRFSGIINPDQITAHNTVQSTQVADARIEYKGSGAISEAQQVGWLQRFFTAIMPF